MMDYQHMLRFVKEMLTNNGGENSTNPNQQFRKRSEHCRRTYGWCKQLLKEEPLTGLREEILLTCAIFHDCGYNDRGIPHETLGADIFRAYMDINHPSKTALKEAVAHMILLHSQKELLYAQDTVPELILLMEADLLEEEGAMGIVTDCFTIAQMGTIKLDYVKDHLKKHAGSILDQFPMVTPYAKTCWTEKQKLVASFLSALEHDLFF